MCVKVIVQLQSHATHLGVIEQAVRKLARVDLHLEEPSRSIGSQALVFSISERDAGCGCSWVIDTGDWQNAHWRFKAEAMDALASAVETSLRFATDEASFRAVWLGPDWPDGSEEEISLTGSSPGSARIGAISTTVIAGVEAIRRGLGKPIGSLTQMGTIRLGKRTENRVPRIADFVPLAGLDDLVFGAWDIFPDNAYEAAVEAGVLERHLLEQLRPELEAVSPMKGVFDPRYVKRLHGTWVKEGSTKADLARQLMDDIDRFRDENRVDLHERRGADHPPGAELLRGGLSGAELFSPFCREAGP